jgi:hypothetical protein
MSVRAREAVRDHSRMKGAARNIMTALADMAKDDGIAWPGQRLLARHANVDPRTVRRVVPEIVAAGELEVRVERGGLHRRAYRLTLSTLEKPMPQRPPWELDEPWGATRPEGNKSSGQVVRLDRGHRGRSARARSSEPKGSAEPKGGALSKPTMQRGGLKDDRFSDYDQLK